MEISNKVNLPRITAVCIDGRRDSDMERYRKILRYMVDRINFGSIKFFGVKDPEVDGVEFYNVGTLGIVDYSKFCLFKLSDYIQTDYCLIFQNDGFVINPNLWSDDFFNYDYIGSPWPLYMGWPKEGKQVGNGGFSLRSKSLLEHTKTLTNHTTENEDTFLISNVASWIKIAPLEIAIKFSVENPIDKDHNLHTCFGFHSKKQLDEAIKIITGEDND